MYIYFVYCNTEFYQSESRIIGIYTTQQEATNRIESQQDMKERENGAFGAFWRNRTHSLRYLVRKYPLGDCDCTRTGV